MKVLLDMNMSPRLMAMLAAADIETANWASVGKADEPDHEIMAYAAANNYVVLTNDLDFGILLSSGTRASQALSKCDWIISTQC